METRGNDARRGERPTPPCLQFLLSVVFALTATKARVFDDTIPALMGKIHCFAETAEFVSTSKQRCLSRCGAPSISFCRLSFCRLSFCLESTWRVGRNVRQNDLKYFGGDHRATMNYNPAEAGILINWPWLLPSAATPITVTNRLPLASKTMAVGLSSAAIFLVRTPVSLVVSSRTWNKPP